MNSADAATRGNYSMLSGRTAVITGSTSGLGLAMAEAFAQAGCHIVLNGFGDKDSILQCKRQMEKVSGTSALYHPADVSRAEDCAAIIQTATEHFGGVDVLVNNAGIQHVSPIEDFPAERWNAILAINLSAAFHTTKAALPGMRQRGWGRIINISSVQGLVGSMHKSAYVAAKHGLIGLTKVTALEVASTQITCNAICPGYVLTSMVERQIEAKAAQRGVEFETAAREFLQEKQPSLRFTKAEHVANLAVFLSSEAASNINGAALPVDGGWTAQ
jgi:3-hydroxybutyrate dehydrogenase